MRILTTLPQNDLNDVPAAVATAESAGFDGVITMENRHDPFLALAVAATASKRIELGTAVATAFPRSPIMVANTCWDEDRKNKASIVMVAGVSVRSFYAGLGDVAPVAVVCNLTPVERASARPAISPAGSNHHRWPA